MTKKSPFLSPKAWVYLRLVDNGGTQKNKKLIFDVCFPPNNLVILLLLAEKIF